MAYYSLPLNYRNQSFTFEKGEKALRRLCRQSHFISFINCGLLSALATVPIMSLTPLILDYQFVPQLYLSQHKMTELEDEYSIYLLISSFPSQDYFRYVKRETFYTAQSEFQDIDR